MLKMGKRITFWDFPSCAKWDEIIEGQHDYLYHGALGDWQTGVNKVETNVFILYGDNEALLFRPVKFIYRMGVELLGAFLSLRS